MKDRTYNITLVILIAVTLVSIYANGWLVHKRFSAKTLPLVLRLCQTNADCKKLGADLYCNPAKLGACKVRAVQPSSTIK